MWPTRRHPGFTFVTGHIEPDPITDVSSGARTAGDTAPPRTAAATFAFGVEALIEGLKLMLQPTATATDDWTP